MVPSNQRRLRNQIRNYEPPHDPRCCHLLRPRRCPNHLDRILHAFHDRLLNDHDHRRRSAHPLTTRLQPQCMDRLPSPLRHRSRFGYSTAHDRRPNVSRGGRHPRCYGRQYVRADAGRGAFHRCRTERVFESIAR